MSISVCVSFRKREREGERDWNDRYYGEKGVKYNKWNNMNVGREVLEGCTYTWRTKETGTRDFFTWSTAADGSTGAQRELWEDATTMGQMGACIGIWEAAMSGHLDHECWAPGTDWETITSDRHNLLRITSENNSSSLPSRCQTLTGDHTENIMGSIRWGKKGSSSQREERGEE